MEFFFWAFVVALLIFAFGGALSIYEGIHKINHPELLADAWINFIVLGPCIVFEALSFRVAWREMRGRAPNLRPWTAIRASKDPSVFAIMLEDAAALAGLAMALLGLSLLFLLHSSIWDGLASIAIGVILVVTSVVLAREVLSLMTGESASRITLDQARSILTSDKRVKAIQELLSLHLGPQDILLAVSIDFDDSMTSPEIEEAARDLTEKLRGADMGITRVFLKPVEPAEENIRARA